jgi:hypothetical protein
MNSTYYSTPYAASRAATPAGADGVVAAMLGMGVIFWIAVIALAILTVVAQWKVFKKANVDGWEALIPIHSTIVELQLGGVKTYWYFLNLIVICGIGPIVFSFWKSIALAKAFGKGTGFGVLLALLPFVGYPILAWGNAEYVGPQTNETPKTTTEA